MLRFLHLGAESRSGQRFLCRKVQYLELFESDRTTTYLTPRNSSLLFPLRCLLGYLHVSEGCSYGGLASERYNLSYGGLPQMFEVVLQLNLLPMWAM